MVKAGKTIPADRIVLSGHEASKESRFKFNLPVNDNDGKVYNSFQLTKGL